MMARVQGIEISIKLVVLAPPAGVAFALQRGKADLHEGQVSTGACLSFSFPVEVLTSTAGPADFRGPFVQGKRGERFFYLNSGTLAGQAGSCWTRRAKIKLEGLPVTKIKSAAGGSGLVFVGTIEGTGRDGGPVCASTALVDGAWRIEQAT